MNTLIAAALFFVGIHLLISGTALRGRLVQRLGERGYLAAFSLLSVAGLAWLIQAYTGAKAVTVSAWHDYAIVAAALNLLAFLLIVLGVTSRGPTLVGGGALLASEDAARGIHRITRHPMLWGFALWGATHMAFNPDAASLIFFGSFTVLGVLGPFSIDAKRAQQHGEAWQRYLAKTSNVPFVAILQGRNHLAIGELGYGRLAAALAVYATFLVLHGRLFRVPVF